MALQNLFFLLYLHCKILVLALQYIEITIEEATFRFRALDLKFVSHWFSSFTLSLAGFVRGSPDFNSTAELCK